MTQCSLDGQGVGAVRFCTLVNGAQLTERIVEIDHTNRRFRYAIAEHPLPVSDLSSNVEIHDLGGGQASVSWGASYLVEPEHHAELESMFGEIYEKAIQGLEQFLNTK